MNEKLLLLISLLFYQLLFSACKSKATPYEPTYLQDTSNKKTLVYGVPTQAYYEIHAAFVKYLNERLSNTHIKIVASSDFSAYLQKLDSGVFDLAIANGVMVVDDKFSGYSLIGESIGEDPNVAVILVNKDSSIHNFSDLQGRSIASLQSPALQGHMLPMLYLFKRGLDVNKGIRLKYLESFESVILNVYLGKCSAGFTSINGWHTFLKKRPEIASRVAVKWVTPATPGNTLLIRNDLDKKTADTIKYLVLSMNQNTEGRKALADLGYVKFSPADSNTYLPIMSFLKEYHKLIVDTKY
jgi:phosphonate transport system substrate-binding protein